MKKRKILSIMMMFLISSCNTNTNNINDLDNSKLHIRDTYTNKFAEEKIPNHCGGTGPLPERFVQPGGFGGRLWHCCSNPACRSSADHLDKPENRTAGLDTDPRREEVPQQILLQRHERPREGVSLDGEAERLHGLQKVLPLKGNPLPSGRGFPAYYRLL